MMKKSDDWRNAMATMNDIAKLAGVSRGTVSNVLNNRDIVSYDKIKLVEEAAAKLGYNLDKNAKALRSGSTDVLALILPSVSGRRYADLYTGVLSQAQKSGFEVRLFLTSDFPYKEVKAIDTALNERVCGILSVSCLDDPGSYRFCETQGLPVIFLERPLQDHRFPSYSLELGNSFAALTENGRPENISVITENIKYQNQYILIKEIKKAFRFSNLSFYEYTGEESEVIFDAVRAARDGELFITSNEEIATKLLHTYAAFYGRRPDIHTLSSLRPDRNLDFQDIPLNYRRLGKLAAQAVIDKKRTGHEIGSCILPPEEDPHPFSPVPARIGAKPSKLRMLAHKTPAVHALQKLTPEFTAMTGIEVEIHTFSLSETLEKMKDPTQQWDVIRIDPSSLYYIAPSVLTRLEDIDSGYQDLFRHFLSNIPRDYSVSGDEVYALPFDIGMQLLFYRKSWFDSIREQRAYLESTGNVLSVPRSFGEFDRICRFFTRSLRPDSPSEYGCSGILASPTSVANLVIPRLIAAIGYKEDSHTSLNLLSEPAYQSLSDFLELARYSDPRIASGWSEIAENFVNGLYALSILHSHHASLLIRTNSVDLGGEIGFAPMPSGNSQLAGGSLGVGRYSRNKEAAYEFIRWAAGPSVAPRLVRLGGSSACRNVYQQEALLDTYPWLSFIKENIGHSIRRPIFFFGSYAYSQRDFEFVFGSNIISVINGSKTLHEALTDTQAYIDRLVAGPGK